MKCTGSGTKTSVSDYCVMFRQAHCPVCGKMVKITIPDRKMNGNVAKFANHSNDDKEPR
jgi:phage/plasmid primase-like uncharacterized protein